MASARAALGFSVHTGWAALVAVAVAPGPARAAAILDRRRVEMLGDDRERPRFVYHAAAELPPARAEAFVRELRDAAHAAARAALAAALRDLRAREAKIVAATIIATGRPPPASLTAILASHALIHTAEGALFRAAIRAACEAEDVPAGEIRASELPARAAAALRMPPARLAQHLVDTGRAAGKPWAKDQKDAYLAARLALAGEPAAR